MKGFWKACSPDFLSVKYLVQHAVLILIVFGIVHLFGLREYTSILNGTTGNLNVSFNTAATLGFIYVVTYLAAILVVPIFLLAALMILLFKRLTSRNASTHESGPNSSTTN